MPAPAWPTVVSALVSGATGAVPAGTSVYDGPVVSNDDPSAYLTIGHSPTSEADNGGRFEQSLDPMNAWSWVEAGAVVCEAGAITGDTVIPDAFAIVTAVTDWLAADQTLGGVLESGSVVTADVDVLQAQTTSGGVQRLVVTVSYQTRV